MIRDIDTVDQLLRAWRDDIDSVPIPNFAELLIPTEVRE